MKYVKIVQNAIDELQGLAKYQGDTLTVVPAFTDDRGKFSSIVQLDGTDRFGIIGVNVEGVSHTDEPLTFFIFNGKLYDYCKAEGFTREQMVDDESFENKVIINKTREEFFNFILGE